MNTPKNKIYPLLFIILLTISAIQGNRLNALQESEAFYRWMISASSLTRLGDPLEPDASIKDSMDDELFAQLVPLTESILPDYEVDPEFDVNDAGEPNSRILRAVRSGDDDTIWEIAQSAELDELKQEFIGYQARHQIQSSGSQFGFSDLYTNTNAANATSSVQGVGLTNMFFGMRTLAANFLWLKVDTYWHSGELHRMIPLMHTCVALDPHFVDAYLLGAWHLAYNVTSQIAETPEIDKEYSEKYKKRLGKKDFFYYSATDFLKGGIRNNPRDYRIYFDLGYSIYELKLSDHVNAIRYMDEAIRHKHDRWVPRMLNRSLMLNGQYEDALAGWDDYLITFPDNTNAIRFIKINNAYLHDAIADEATECKQLALDAQKSFLEQAASNPSQAEKLQAEAQKASDFAQEMDDLAKKEYNAGMAIWIKLATESENDTLAAGRIARTQASKLRSQGRYLDAIAELDIIRWEDLQFFEEASNMIIEIKKEANIPFTVSEQMELLRQEDIKNIIGLDEDTPAPIQRIECIYRDI